MKKINIELTIPRYREEQAILKECARLLGAFLDLCENSPDRICESDVQSFFDTFTRMEAIQDELSSSKWPNGRELSNVAKDCLNTAKSRFDELGICIQCVYNNDHTERLTGFEQIRTVF